MKPQGVCVAYVESDIGMRLFYFARNLAKRLDEMFLVTVPDVRNGDESDSLKARISSSICRAADVSHLDGMSISFGDLTSSIELGNIIFVCESAADRQDLITLVPFDEESLTKRGDGPVLIPLGDNGSGEYAAREGIEIAKALGLSVVFYHTTWREEDVDSDDPRDHMNTGARQVLEGAIARAEELEVLYKAVPQTDLGVADGIVLAAGVHECSMILMARGTDTLKGSYVDQVLELSRIPVLVMGQEEVK